MATGTRKAAKRADANKKPKAEAPFFRPFEKLPKAAKKADAKAAPNASPTKSPPAKIVQPTRDDAADADSFARYMSGVKALDGDGSRARIPRTASEVNRASRDAAPGPDLDAPARAMLQSLVADGVRFDVTDDGSVLEGRRIDTEPREVRRLRRGSYAVDATVDLHGLSLPDARDRVTSFVTTRARAGDRVVRIVHGKGSHSPRGVGVLRGEIGAWLSEGKTARCVVAFASAPDDEGGGGAVLVLLAR